MAQLAIKGHSTRGNEVIKILEMLGGKDEGIYEGTEKGWIYTINEEGFVDLESPYRYAVYSLEEFLERYPYKVGDKVYYDNKVCDVIEMLWNSSQDTISYGVYDGKIKNLAIVEELKPYKEETMKEKDEKSANHVFDTEIISFDIAQRDKYELDLQGKFDVKLREGKYYVERIKPQYPKTYEECCKVLDYEPDRKAVTGYDAELIENLQTLKLCRDAYWKIEGDWKPDWNSVNSKKFKIYTCKNKIHTGISLINNYILAFPSEEMRDAFYENFKELIEECKELL